MIKISIRDITSKSLDINRTIPKEGIGLSDAEIDLRSPIEVKAHLERLGDVVRVDARIKADFGFLCVRCLEELHEVQMRDYHFDFEITAGVEYVDLGEEIRQELILDNPAKILCRKECKGICPKCGVNLNIERCTCQ